MVSIHHLGEYYTVSTEINLYVINVFVSGFPKLSRQLLRGFLQNSQMRYTVVQLYFLWY